MLKSLAHALAALLLFFTIPGLGAEREQIIAEIWVNEADAHCIFRADLPGGAREDRKEKVLNFLRRASADHVAWNVKYALFDVDYSDFSQFGVVIMENCDASALLLDQIVSFFSNCGSGQASPCVGQDLRLSQQGESPFVVKGYVFEVPVARFERIKGQESLRECSMAARMKDSVKGDDDRMKSSRALQSLMSSYRMPLMDIFAADNRHYFLFSRLCDRKEELFEDMKALLKSDGYDWETYFHDPDFAPDVSAYRFAQTGARGLRPPPGRSTW